MGKARSVTAPMMCVPEKIPTLMDLKRLMPAHCFQPHLATSFYYVFKDAFIIALLYACMVLTEQYCSVWALLVVAPLYTYLLGTMMWALFVLGHDCGHDSFSHHATLNVAVGTLLHTVIMVPFYPWKVSHRHHHKHTGNIDKDEIFYPVRNEDTRTRKKFLPMFGLGVGWFLYLWTGYAPRRVRHFNPWDSMFGRHMFHCTISCVSCALWAVFGLGGYAAHFGFQALLLHYIAPLFVFASWLVITTFLHHQDELVPWYADHKWDFVRGQLSSVDRHYGWAHNLVHNIGTHQVHHLFSKIPHYHLEECAAIFRNNYPELVRQSNQPILPAFFKMFQLFNSQQYIDESTEVHIYDSSRTNIKSDPCKKID